MKPKNILIINILTIIFGYFSYTSAQSSVQCPSMYPANHVDYDELDTVVTLRNNGQIELAVDYFFTASNFNGTYKVEEIPYEAPNRTALCIPSNKLFLPADDVFDTGKVSLPFNFAFFGEKKDYAVVGANGMVTFNASAVKHSNGYSNSGKPLPWPNNDDVPTWGITSNDYGINYPEATADMMRDAIYGVMSDVHPKILQPSYNQSRHGIFRGVSGVAPCRYGFFIWDSVPMYSNINNISDFYIKFFEGTNIIEVHVNNYVKAGTSQGIVGIQNKTGKTQKSTYDHRVGEYTDYIRPNSPGYFAPTGYNTFSQNSFSNKAWRFTPQGSVRVNLAWYKLSGANLEDSTQILTNTEYDRLPIDDPRYIIRHEAYIPDRQPGQTSADDKICVVSPRVPTTYCCKVLYIGSANIKYALTVNFHVGIDTNNITNLTSNDTLICNGSRATIHLEYPTTGAEPQTLDTASWMAFRIINGQRILLPENRMNFNATNTIMTLEPLPTADIIPNHIDSTIILCKAEYTNGNRKTDSILIRSFPNFEFTRDTGICQGQTLHFGGHDYTQTCIDSLMFQSAAGCDSLEILHLTVFDVSHTTDRQKDCKPYTWPHNNETYLESTNAPTVTLKNRFHCDSIVNLNLEIIPVHAKITTSTNGVTLDDLNVILTDISEGNTSRKWIFEDGSTSNSHIHNYIYPSDKDSVTVELIAISNLGCTDTAQTKISLLREALWVPNAFAPLAEAPNNKFKPTGIGITYLKGLIFNRYGERVAILDGINDSWDGLTEDGRVCPQGAYVYKIQYKTILAPESMQVKTGTITLIR